MNTEFIDKHLFTPDKLVELYKRWERVPLKRKYKKGSYSADKYGVAWLSPTAGNPALQTDSALSLDDARDVLADTMSLYYDDAEFGGLLVTAQAGMGKSTAAIKFAQDVADNGGRVLYLMPRHAYWDDITSSPFYEAEYWYHWRATHAEHDTGERMCRLHDKSRVWMAKGYPLIKMCKSLCLDDGWMYECPYRSQAKTKARIVAGVHNHATTGLSIKDFDVVICDELPLGAFVSERLIRTGAIDTVSNGKVAELLITLRDLSADAADQTYSRRSLLEHIAPLLDEIYAQLGDDEVEPDHSPPLWTEDDVDDAREWYLPDLLALLIPELMAYNNDYDDWMSRVYVDRKGLHLMIKNPPWKDLPPKIIALDATGRSDIYQRLFGIDFTTVEPNVELKGRIHQVANTLNNISAVLKPSVDGEPRELTWRGREMLALCQYIAVKGNHKRVGIVTFKGARHHFEEVFGKKNVMHFGGSRGSNGFEGDDEDGPVDCVIVAGTPAAPDDDIIQAASQIWFDPLTPERSMISINSGQHLEKIRSSKQVEFPYVREDGMAPYRLLGGMWEVGVMQTVMSLNREDEIRQSLHRARIVIRDTDVWILGTTPTREPLTSFYESPKDIMDTGNLPWKNWVHVHEIISQLPVGNHTLAEVASRFGNRPSTISRWLEGYAIEQENVQWKDNVLTII